MTASAGADGLSPGTAQSLREAIARVPGIERVWLFGSRARGDHRPGSDIDLLAEAAPGAQTAFAQLQAAIDALQLIERVDLLHWQPQLDEGFREQIRRDRRVFWERARPAAAMPRVLGSTELKEFQRGALTSLDRYLAELRVRRTQTQDLLGKMRESGVMEQMPPEARRSAEDYPRYAWDSLRDAGGLPAAYAARPHSSRFDGAGRAIPNVCLKVPTGGGKTLLAAASIARVFEGFFGRHAGMVLWIVPKEAIYRQTLKALRNPDHPYRQMLNVAGAGRVRILEKNDPVRRLEVESHLCVMVLMLASAARESKETLRLFRDRGNVHGFLPPEGDAEAHLQLLQEVPNLDAYGSPWASAQQQRAQLGSEVKSSLGNVMRLVRPLVILDEGQYGYTDIALRTIDGFNPGFLLELSATPREAAGGIGSNILVDVRGTDLEAEQMIKLPIHVDVRSWADWQSCLAASVDKLRALDMDAQALLAECDRYIRPILLVQVERTGKDQTDPAYIHARDVREKLGQLGFSERQIREKTSEKDEIGDEELLSPASDVRVIITKQALQEGWDCPFAYVLCSLAAGRGQRAMTQLVGRILRQPQVAKTGRPSLDACYVYCHDIGTAEVVHTIRRSLESEGMGDLSFEVSGAGTEADLPRPVHLKRRAGLESLRIFLPTVTCADGQERRPLDYDSDVLAHVDWGRIDPGLLARGWKPGAVPGTGGHLVVDLRVLQDETAPLREALETALPVLDRAQIVRSLMDVVPNPWQLWHCVSSVLDRLLADWDEAAIGASAATLVQTLRADLLEQRDALAQQVFDAGVTDGRIEFRLRADRNDYELPSQDTLWIGGEPRYLASGGRPVTRSLLEPAVRTPDLNDFEAVFAGYLDEQRALRWWHRNVAKAQYGLQGWKRHKVYPDFVFGFMTDGQASRVVLIETKGAHLASNADTAYKKALLEALAGAFCDERFRSAGELSLEGGRTELSCDVVVDSNWRAHMDTRFFPAG